MVMPASVALVPSTDCTNNGMNEILPNSAQPERTPCVMDVANSRSRKSGIGRIGSDARFSTQSKRMNNTTETEIKLLVYLRIMYAIRSYYGVG